MTTMPLANHSVPRTVTTMPSASHSLPTMPVANHGLPAMMTTMPLANQGQLTGRRGVSSHFQLCVCFKSPFER